MAVFIPVAVSPYPSIHLPFTDTPPCPSISNLILTPQVHCTFLPFCICIFLLHSQNTDPYHVDPRNFRLTYELSFAARSISLPHVLLPQSLMFSKVVSAASCAFWMYLIDFVWKQRKRREGRETEKYEKGKEKRKARSQLSSEILSLVSPIFQSKWK